MAIFASDADADALSLALIDARNRTLRLLAQFEQQEAATRCAAHGMRSAQWLAGHTGWFQEAWIARNPQRGQGRRCPLQPMRLASIDPAADAAWDPALHPLDGSAPSALPSLEETRAYLLATLEDTLDLLERAEDDGLYFFRLALVREDECAEHLAELAQALDLALEMPPVVAPSSRPALRVPATRWLLGAANATGFCLAAEQGVQEVALPEFEIDAQPVTWSQYAEFVADGGYDRHELWSPRGWEWLDGKVRGEGRRGPRYVEQIGTAIGTVLQRRLGRDVRVAATGPVVHVSWWEADAWCRWAGRRLPLEAEWEAAAHAGARRGFHWGEVHEWTAGTLRPWPGYAPLPAQGEVESMFTHARVRRGASHATAGRLRHVKRRGFATSDEDGGFVGFRSCAV